jgi:hypothetical protein
VRAHRAKAGLPHAGWFGRSHGLLPTFLVRTKEIPVRTGPNQRLSEQGERPCSLANQPEAAENLRQHHIRLA